MSSDAGFSIPVFSPLKEIPDKMLQRLLEEILEERAVSSRGQRKPRGRKRKMSKYPIRHRGELSREKHAWTPEIMAPAQ